MNLDQGELFPTDSPSTPTPTHVLSFGLGADSTAVLLRWLIEPSTRDFDLADLVVITALTNDEFPSTITDVEAAVLPRLRDHGVRYVQVGRNRRTTTTAGDGITTYSDTTSPTRVQQGRGYALSKEMLTAATLPQLASRRCSARAKGAALDPVIARLTAGQPYRHYLGFEAGELRRAQRDATFNTDLRQGVYPLISWGWTRTDATDFIKDVTGIAWQKSACTFCPFQFSSRAGFASALERYRREPTAGADAIYLEAVSLAFNERVGLLAKGRLIDAVRQAGLTEVIRQYQDRVNSTEHGLYEVQRVARPRPGTTPLIARRVRRLDHGTPSAMRLALATRPGRTVIGTDGITRVVRRVRGPQAPWVEHFCVVAPTAEVADKARPGFDAMFASVAQGELLLI
jgi:hypothetical protein